VDLSVSVQNSCTGAPVVTCPLLVSLINLRIFAEPLLALGTLRCVQDKVCYGAVDCNRHAQIYFHPPPPRPDKCVSWDSRR
jgi:hypothetical protein